MFCKARIGDTLKNSPIEQGWWGCSSIFSTRQGVHPQFNKISIKGQNTRCSHLFSILWNTSTLYNTIFGVCNFNILVFLFTIRLIKHNVCNLQNLNANKYFYNENYQILLLERKKHLKKLLHHYKNKCLYFISK